MVIPEENSTLKCLQFENCQDFICFRYIMQIVGLIHFHQDIKLKYHCIKCINILLLFNA